MGGLLATNAAACGHSFLFLKAKKLYHVTQIWEAPPGGCDNWQMSYFLVQCNGIMGAREATRMPRYKHLHVLHAISVSCLHFGRIAESFQTPYLL